MHCGRVSNLLSAYIDRELAGTEMLQIRRHLDGCPGCAAEYVALGRVKSLLAAAPPIEPRGDPTEIAMWRWAQRREQPAVSATRWNWDWHWRWFSGARRWQRYRLAFTSLCLVLALAGTALALRKPNYPDAVAANVLPSLLQPEEKLPPLGSFAPRLERWPSEDGWRMRSPHAVPVSSWSSPRGSAPEWDPDTATPAFWIGR